MSDPRYEIILYWSNEDQAFTYQAALAAAEVAIREWIETARELGREIPQPKGRLLFA